MQDSILWISEIRSPKPEARPRETRHARHERRNCVALRQRKEKKKEKKKSNRDAALCVLDNGPLAGHVM